MKPPRAEAQSDADRKVPFRGGGFAPRITRGPAVIAFAVLIALWQAAVSWRIANPLFLPSPIEIGRALYALAASGELWLHIAASLRRIAIGWLLGTAGGLALGVAIGLFGLARSVGVPLVSALFPIPKIALLPLFILWFGIGEPSKVATIALGVFFPTAVAAFGAVDNVPRSLIRMAQSFGLPFADIVRKVVLPGALPGILSGFRISASIALILVVAAEMINAQYGIGALVLFSGNLMRTDQLLAGVVVLSALGLVIAFVLGRLERRLLRWR
ncbi:MAG: ABC transporter permease [Alphaproteobacteria bacterium]|nr:ABC transporter permease [Alphaproteobacteria bacterium]